MAAGKHLAIYLNDHLGGATMGVELARRVRGANAGTPLGDFLVRFTEEVEADRTTLEALMAELGVRRDHVKSSGAWLAEKAGRLKLNGQLWGYSPLSRLVELELLHLGITGKRDMWQVLRHSLGGVAGFDLEQLAGRAERQATELEGHRIAAARAALAHSG